MIEVEFLDTDCGRLYVGDEVDCILRNLREWRQVHWLGVSEFFSKVGLKPTRTGSGILLRSVLGIRAKQKEAEKMTVNDVIELIEARDEPFSAEEMLVAEIRRLRGEKMRLKADKRQLKSRERFLEMWIQAITCEIETEADGI